MPGYYGGVQSQVLVPVANFLVDELPVFFVVMKNVVAADAVTKRVEAHHVLRVCRSEWSCEQANIQQSGLKVVVKI